MKKNCYMCKCEEKFSFDEIVERKNTDAIKIEGLKLFWNNENLIPMWVADMDFRTPDFILNSIKEKCNEGILGYPACPESWYDAIISWMKKKCNVEVSKKELVFIPGIVKGLIFSIQTMTDIGDGVMIMPPVYHPFRITINNNKRTVVNCPLIYDGNQFFIDKACFEKEIKKCRMFILCNPHNPGGRIWSREELEYIDKVCYENNVLVVSDEIHADIALPGYNCITFSSVSETAKQNSIIFRAPSKAFNMPGIMSSYAIIHNEAIRDRFKEYVSGNEFDCGHIFAYTSLVAAYNHGESWLNSMIDYIQKNVDFLEEYFREKMPDIKPVIPQASFLVFLDCKALNLSQKELNSFFADKAGLALNDGEMFGEEGIGFMRMNVGCPKEILKTALDSLYVAYSELKAEIEISESVNA